MELKIAHLYPDLLNIYGDRGNILALYQRCQWRGIDVSITPLDLGEKIDPEAYDLYFMGGGQDAQQILVCDDLHRVKASALKTAVENQAVFLTICGGYQLLGHYYKPLKGKELKGLGLIDLHTIAGETRLIGNITIDRKSEKKEPSTITGFENHSGLTYLEQGVSPLGRVVTGQGNNGTDGTEGVHVGNLYGTYMHGSLLPKNPILADELIVKALNRRYGAVSLSPLDDTLETLAHQKAVRLPS